MSKLKTKEEIVNEIDLTKKTIENYRKSYKDGKIDRKRLSDALIENEAIIVALSWVLGENDRWD